MNRDSMTIEQLLDRIANAETEGERVSLRAILDAIGHRSFGPLILVAGLIALAPIIGDIPGVPTIVGILVLLTAGQLLFGRKHFWLPRWMLDRSVQRNKLCRALSWMQRPARFFDRLLRPRLSMLTQGAGLYAIAVVCIAIAAAMPLMEVIPFTANGAGLAFTAFGLSLIARDGAMALLALLVTAAMVGFVAVGLF